MRALRYRPYDELADRPNVVVDGSPTPATVLTLSHWPGLDAPKDLQADLSAEMAYRYLDAGGDRHGEAEWVSNNHFDQDGLVGVFALSRPKEAIRRRELLVDLAAAGDFAVYRHRAAARLSMVVAAFADPARSPVAEVLGGSYADGCAALYTELLDRLPTLPDELDRWRDLWGDEDADLAASEAAIATGRVVISEHAEVDLAVAVLTDGDVGRGGHRFGGRWADGVHPMALHRATGCFRVLQVAGRRYRLADRYETWVQYRSTRPRPRVAWAPLAEELTAAEPGSTRWEADDPGDLTPGLRTVDGTESGLDPGDVVDRIRRHVMTAPPAWDPYR